MVVILLALVAAHHESANTLVRQQRLVHGQIGEVGLDGHPLLLIQRLSRLDGIQRRRRITGVVGERIGRQTRWEVVAHASSLRSPAGITPAGSNPPFGSRLARAARPSKRTAGAAEPIGWVSHPASYGGPH
ncbi:hypothetical protein MAHJHV58_47240 [Mycobacterium avium subsp. hominissuis]